MLRDAITALAVLVVLVLGGAIVAPRLVDWNAYRTQIDSRLTRIAGHPVRSEGPLAITLLPAPRIAFRTLLVGGEEPDAPTALLEDLSVELALTPLLRGEVRVTDARVTRADFTLVVRRDGTIAAPARPPGQDVQDLRVILEDISVGSGMVRLKRESEPGETLIGPLIGRASADSLAGPWRIRGAAGDVSVTITTGEATKDGALRVKALIGGDLYPRFEFDGIAGHRIDGQVRLVAGPPVQPPETGSPVPFVMTGQAKGDWTGIALTDLAVEALDGAASLRLAGEGTILPAPNPRVKLSLVTKLADLDTWYLRLRDRMTGAGTPQGLPIPVDLAIAAERVLFGGGEVRDAALSVTLARREIVLNQFSGILPGEARTAFAGEARLAATPSLTGRLTVTEALPDPLANWLTRIGFPPPRLLAQPGERLTLRTDLTAAREFIAARNIEFALGPAQVSGALRFTPGENGVRGRFDAQVRANGVDLARLPALDGLSARLAGLDFGLTVDARDVTFDTPGQPDRRLGAGRVQARIVADPAGLAFETLDIDGLAGLDARLRGTLPVTGPGRIEGEISAARLAPAVTLLAKLTGRENDLGWLPPVVLDAPLKGKVIVTPEPAREGQAAPLRIAFNGASGQARVEGEAGLARGSEGVSIASAQLVIDDASGKTPAVGWPQRLSLVLAPGPQGPLELALDAVGPGIRIETRKAATQADTGSASAELSLAIDDLTPWLAALGLPPQPPGQAGAARLTLGLTRIGDVLALRPAGDVAGARVGGALEIDWPTRRVRGQLTLDAAPLPALALPALGLRVPAASSSQIWPSARFGDGASLPVTGEIGINVGRLDLGGGLAMREMGATLALTPDGAVGFRNLRGTLRDMPVTGDITLGRNSGSVSAAGTLRFANAMALAPAGLQALLQGRMDVTMRFGASGESPAALVAALAGAGEMRWEEPVLPRLSSEAPLRAAIAGIEASAGMPGPRDLAEQVARTLPSRAFVPVLEGPLTLPLSLSGGVVRAAPVRLEGRAGGTLALQGALDLRTFRINLRGDLASDSAPEGWSGPLPQAVLLWDGPAAGPTRTIDTGSLLTGVAAIRLTRELETIERFEQDARERAFFNRRLRASRDQDRFEQERIATEKARAERELAEKEQAAKAEAARAEAERARAERERQERERAAKERAEREAAAEREAERRALERLVREQAPAPGGFTQQPLPAPPPAQSAPPPAPIAPPLNIAPVR